jgi:hypothetical protein
MIDFVKEVYNQEGLTLMTLLLFVVLSPIILLSLVALLLNKIVIKRAPVKILNIEREYY